MHDFPPRLGFYARRYRSSGVSRRAVGEPDTRTPGRFLWWVVRRQLDLVALGAVVGAIWFVPGTLGPFLVGRAIDTGIRGGSTDALRTWALLLAAVVVVGAGFGVLMHTLAVRSWLVALYGTILLVTRKTNQLGHVLPQRTPTGEVLAVSGGDSDQFGSFLEVLARACGALLAYLVITGFVLATSVRLGVVVLLAAPLLIALALPLLRPQQRRQAIERNRTSDLTSMATDIVAGLRILRGIGGERTFGRNYASQSQSVREAGVAAGTWQGLVDATGVLCSGLFLVALAWVGGGEVQSGRITIGQLVSFFGYAIFLIWPIETFFELAQKWVRSLVSAAKTIAVLEQQPPWRELPDPTELPTGATIVDRRSGLVVSPGRFTVVVSSVPDDSAALADRLGRYLSEDAEPVSLELGEGVKGRTARRQRLERRAEVLRRAERDRVRAESDWGVEVGGVDLAAVPIETVRERILLSDTSAQLFAGTLRSAVDPHRRLTREQAEAALHVAAAEDVYDAVPGGWAGRIDERGRGLSGGQRQRVVLARAIAADPEVLVLVEPTSSVDAHTEAAIAGRLATARRGRTTVVMSVSPLLLHHADEVALLVDGRVVAQGRHLELLERPDYRQTVIRSLDGADV